ncbi:extracellular solute-binding protein [Nitratireductor indicus]|uniref:extracellular solute-binding protein n=1 Tax=Nitratireductor indicus TaxID=721133 RepID=UPI002874C044|nr:extracellular solute-binding protein [Nitratireductor indicus]MDS1138096.1 extracellular solute-binding protein [Nitratireductor indicus]
MIDRRNLLAGVAALALLGSVAAAAAEPAEISFAASMLGEPLRGPLLTALVEEFNQSQDAVHVTPVTTPFSSFGTTMFTQMGGGGGPDVIAFDQPNIYAAAEAGLLVSLDEVVDGVTLLPGNNSLIVDGVQYGVALDISNYALIYNPKLVTKVPTTFDELVAEAKAQTKDGVYGFAFRHTQAEEAGVWYDLSNYVYGNGGHWAVDGNPTINSAETIAGVTAYKTLYDANVIPKGADAATYRRMFAEGKIAMMIDNGGIPTVLKGTNPDAAIAAAPAPLPTKAIGQVMAALAINGNSKSPDAAKAFMKWFLTLETQAKVQGFLGGSTAATPIARTKEELEKAPYIEVFDSLGDVALPFMPQGLEAETPQVRNIVVEAVMRVLAGQTDVAAAMNEAQSQVEALR